MDQKASAIIPIRMLLSVTNMQSPIKQVLMSNILPILFDWIEKKKYKKKILKKCQKIKYNLWWHKEKKCNLFNSQSIIIVLESLWTIPFFICEKSGFFPFLLNSLDFSWFHLFLVNFCVL